MEIVSVDFPQSAHRYKIWKMANLVT